jgi:hypothetical protein
MFVSADAKTVQAEIVDNRWREALAAAHKAFHPGKAYYAAAALFPEHPEERQMQAGNEVFLLELRERLGITLADLATYENKLTDCERTFANPSRADFNQAKARRVQAESGVREAEELYQLVRLLQATDYDRSKDHKFVLSEGLSHGSGPLSVNEAAERVAAKKALVAPLKDAEENIHQERLANQESYKLAVLNIQTAYPLITNYRTVKNQVLQWFDGKIQRQHWGL